MDGRGCVSLRARPMKTRPEGCRSSLAARPASHGDQVAPSEVAQAAVVVRAQGTRAEDLSRPIEDGVRRLAQLSDYRTRLTELAGRPDTKTDDLIKIVGEVSRAQSEIEAADAQQRGLTERVETEALTIALESDLAAGGIWAPVRETWRRAGALLGESAGDALRFAIAALPWTPIAVGFLALLRWVWRRHRGKPA